LTHYRVFDSIPATDMEAVSDGAAIKEFRERGPTYWFRRTTREKRYAIERTSVQLIHAESGIAELVSVAAHRWKSSAQPARALFGVKTSITLPADLLERLDRIDSNRSAFLKRAAPVYLARLEHRVGIAGTSRLSTVPVRRRPGASLSKPNCISPRVTVEMTTIIDSDR
jgi:hypothetical protein